MEIDGEFLSKTSQNNWAEKLLNNNNQNYSSSSKDNNFSGFGFEGVLSYSYSLKDSDGKTPGQAFKELFLGYEDKGMDAIIGDGFENSIYNAAYSRLNSSNNKSVENSKSRNNEIGIG